MRVTLALRDTEDAPETQFVGEASGVGDVILEPRLAVEATLAAIGEATGDPGHFRLVGIKVVPAFDTRVVLVCLRTSDERSAQVVGAVPLRGAMARTAAMAALDATNRLVGALLGAPEAEGAGGTEAPVPTKGWTRREPGSADLNADRPRHTDSCRQESE